MNILTRKNLKALNVPDEAIDAIVEAHSDAINDIKAERDKYAEEAKQIATLTTERDTLKQQLADAKKSGGDAQKIQEAFDAYKQQVETEKKTATLTTAARKLLTSKGMQEKLADLVMAKRGLDGIELDDKGAIKDGEKLIDALKGEYGDLFSTQQQQGTPTTTPPAMPRTAADAPQHWRRSTRKICMAQLRRKEQTNEFYQQGNRDCLPARLFPRKRGRRNPRNQAD